jgi:hypothetical protein
VLDKIENGYATKLYAIYNTVILYFLLVSVNYPFIRYFCAYSRLKWWALNLNIKNLANFYIYCVLGISIY